MANLGAILSALWTSAGGLMSVPLKALGFSSLIPALVFVVSNETVLLSLILKYRRINLGNEIGITLLVFWTLLMTVLIGYMLNVLNSPILSFFTGYPFRLTWLGRVMTYFQKRRKRKFEEGFQELQDFIAEEIAKLPKEVVSDEEFMSGEFLDWIRGTDLFQYVERELATYGFKLQTYFPSHESALAPTALGNTIAAFEEYPKSRYGIDAIFLWYRLVPILSEEEYIVFVEKAKSGVDFLLNLSLLTAIFAIECVVMELVGIKLSVLIPAAALLGAYFLYRRAVENAAEWGETIKVAFDSYRYELAHRLSIKPFHNSKEEFARWRAVSQLIIKGEAFGEFDYPLPKKLQPKPEK